jgi:purine-cytosine permease-like protein
MGDQHRPRHAPVFEHIGVDRIDENIRTSTPWTFAAVYIGGSIGLANLTFGWIPITFGLGLWAALSSIAVGSLLGLVLIVPLILIGSRTATNNSTASGAHFGVRGRLIGSFVGLAIMFVYTAISIWAGGTSTVAVLGRLFHTPTNKTALGITYTVIALIVVVIAVYGYHLLVRATKVLAVGGGLLVVAALIAFAPHLTLNYPGHNYLLGDFWSTWLLSAVAVGAGGPMAITTILGDWTRYISPSRYPARKLLPVASLGIFVGTFVPTAIGTLVAVTFANPYGDFVQNLASTAPTWYAVMLLPLALFGGLGLAAETVYSGGLDLDAIFPYLSRARATLIMSAGSVVLVLLGSLVWDISTSIYGASLILIAISAPWAAIVGLGYLRCRGQYHLDDLQVFNRRQRGGAYWYAGGWNWRAIIAWAAGSIFGVLAVSITSTDSKGNTVNLYTGPWANIANGVNVSFLGPFLIAGVLYLVLGADRLSPRLAVTDAVEVPAKTNLG